MTNQTREWVSAAVSPDLVKMLDAIAAQSPHISSRSDLIRRGIRLALEESARKGIDDPDLELRVLRYLHETKDH